MHDRKLLLFHFLFNVNMKEASCASDLARSFNAIMLKMHGKMLNPQQFKTAFLEVNEASREVYVCECLSDLCYKQHN